MGYLEALRFQSCGLSTSLEESGEVEELEEREELEETDEWDESDGYKEFEGSEELEELEVSEVIKVLEAIEVYEVIEVSEALGALEKLDASDAFDNELKESDDQPSLFPGSNRSPSSSSANITNFIFNKSRITVARSPLSPRCRRSLRRRTLALSSVSRRSIARLADLDSIPATIGLFLDGDVFMSSPSRTGPDFGDRGGGHGCTQGLEKLKSLKLC